jgi:hypothetical protein
MLIKTCFSCTFHKVKEDEEMQASFCRKEGCWSAHTDCITQKAVERFLIEECRISDGTLKLNQGT